MSLLERLEKQKRLPADKSWELTANPGTKTTESTDTAAHLDLHGDFKHQIHLEVIETMNKLPKGKELTEKNADEVMRVIQDLVELKGSEIPYVERRQVIKELFDEVAGLGPLEPLLNSDEITEIMVNGPHQVFVEKKGKITLSSVKFRNTEHVMKVIDRIVSRIGRHVDEASPMVDARLPDGSRVNVIIPPISLIGPTITIRKFSKKPITAQDLVRFGSTSPQMMSFLEACVKGRKNIIVSGGTGSGKTTLLNVLSAFIPDDQRIVTIEDAAELSLRQRHVITLESRAPNIEGRGGVSIRDLVRNSLRMRPDRIVVGEVRSGETLDMLQAMNTGHDGSLTTGHANSPRDILSRLETMVMMAGMELPIKAIREQMASALDIIIQQSRMRDGSRKIVNITEVVGMEGDIITLQDIFVYEMEDMDNQGKVRGRFTATGAVPSFVSQLQMDGILVNNEWFSN